MGWGPKILNLLQSHAVKMGPQQCISLKVNEAHIKIVVIFENLNSRGPIDFRSLTNWLSH